MMIANTGSPTLPGGRRHDPRGEGKQPLFYVSMLRKVIPIFCLVFLAVQILQTKSMLSFVKGHSYWSFPDFSDKKASSESSRSFTEETRSSSSVTKVIPHEGETEPSLSGGPSILPDWRIGVDCSAYSRDCIVKKFQTGQRYADYPLQFTEESKHKYPYSWQKELPDGWKKQSLDAHAPVLNRENKQDTNNKTPTATIATAYKDPSVQKCLEAALQKSVDEQLDELLKNRLLGKLNNKHHMVAFTISDYSYAKNQIHDIFAMAHDTVEMPGAFFMVTMDTATTEMACEAGYPFLMWPQTTEEDGALRSVVANTKLEISMELLKRNQSFVFFEMDIWFIQSPKRFLDEQTVDMMFASHLNNPNAVNIGVYSAIANNATREYFQHCIDILEQAPSTHDQMVMQTMLWMTDDHNNGKELAYHDMHYNDPKPRIPIIRNPLTRENFNAFQIISDVRLLPTPETLAIHPLCWQPLVSPHGKQMMAKEFGAWYGAKGYYRKTADIDNNNEQSHKRYLWMDGGYPWNSWSPVMTWNSYHPHYDYHQRDSMQWNIAINIALARRTNRIWVMPKILDERGVQFLWTNLDLEPVEKELDVEVRETNFPADPRAWKSTAEPFSPVARAAMDGKWNIFAQLNASAIDEQGSWTDDILSWDLRKLDLNGSNPFDAFFALHSALPELDNAELLLSGLPAGLNLFRPLKAKYRKIVNGGKLVVSPAEWEIFEVWKALRWCKPADKDKMDPGQEHNTAGRTVAPWDCYGRGEDETLLLN